MPQKPVFSKPPLLTASVCFPSNGTVRIRDERISRLYQEANSLIDRPEVWEGLFRVACLVRNHPLDEPVFRVIHEAIHDTENGAFDGTVTNQIHIARAAFSVYEYNADRTILKRLAVWLRYFEIEYEQLASQDGFLYRPADMLELLVHFYRITGIQSTLRLCAKIRATAFDWTTVLQTFQQSIPIENGDASFLSLLSSKRPAEIEYDQKEQLVNHAEMLADGVRYSLYSGIFSGNGQDLTAGRNGWKYLRKHHLALCGGTTSDPFLSGRGADRMISNRALFAWTEAFASQLYLPDSDWALDELIRIVYNGLEDCLNRTHIPEYQRLNSLGSGDETSGDTVLLARFLRAIAAAGIHSISLTEDGCRINYTLTAKYMLMIHKNPVMILADRNSVRFQSRKPFRACVDYYISPYASGNVSIILKDDVNRLIAGENEKHTGFYVHTDELWSDQDGYDMEPDRKVVTEETHHQGVCFYLGKQLLSHEVSGNAYSLAVCGLPEYREGEIMVETAVCTRWPARGTVPSDIPVLPPVSDEHYPVHLMPYSATSRRITVFPRIQHLCLK